MKIENLTMEDYFETMGLIPFVFEEDKKSTEKSEHHRCQGNEFFKQEAFRIAAMCYTVGLCHAPPKSGCLAICYGNRSAATFHLRAYQECIVDIDRALHLPCSPALRSKLVERKNRALKCMDVVSTTSEPIPEIQSDEFKANQNIPELHVGLDIVFNRQSRCRLVANKILPTGTILAVHKPLLFVPLIANSIEYCHHCMKNTLCPIPCERCTQVIYCSDTCKTRASESYHRVECPIKYNISMIGDNYVDSMFTTLRFLNVFTNQGASMSALVHEMEQAEQLQRSKDPESVKKQFHSSQLCAFFNLTCKPLPKYKPKLEHQMIYLTTILQNHTDFCQPSTDINLLAQIIFKVSSIYECHRTVIRHTATESVFGVAIYPLLNVTPHSCFTNTISYTCKDNMVLYASQTIKPGEPILFNYRNIVFNPPFDRPPLFKSPRFERSCICCKKILCLNDRQRTFKVGKVLSKKLKEDPFDIISLWEVLIMIQTKTRGHNWRAEIIKSMITDSLELHKNKDGLYLLQFVGIL